MSLENIHQTILSTILLQYTAQNTFYLISLDTGFQSFVTVKAYTTMNGKGVFSSST